MTEKKDTGKEVVAEAPPSSEVKHSNIDFKGARLHYLTAGPESGPSLLLLHGAAFHSGTWLELGTLKYFASKGIRTVALDLPGFGKSEKVSAVPETYLEDLIAVLGLGRPIVVSPSMSGRFSFPLVHQHPGAVRGFVPVAPALAAEYAEKLKGSGVPTLIIWGEDDNIFPVSQADLLERSIEGARKLILKDAPHPCYLERTEEFHEAVLEFCRSLDH